MTLQKLVPLILLMFTVLCALPAAAAVGMIPSAFAQEQEDDDNQNLASGIVSEVLDNSGDVEDEANQDATNTAADEGSNQEQDVGQDDISTFGDDAADLGDINVAVPVGVPVDTQEEEVVEEAPITPTPPEEQEEELPEFVAFCNQLAEEDVLHCYQTLEDCIIGEELFGVQDSDCQGVETVPPDAGDCAIFRNDEGEPGLAVCAFRPQ